MFICSACMFPTSWVSARHPRTVTASASTLLTGSSKCRRQAYLEQGLSNEGTGVRFGIEVVEVMQMGTDRVWGAEAVTVVMKSGNYKQSEPSKGEICSECFNSLQIYVRHRTPTGRNHDSPNSFEQSPCSCSKSMLVRTSLGGM